MSQPQPFESDVVYAGFLRRWAAIFLDGMILSAAYYALFLIAMVVAIGASGLESLNSEEPSAAVMGAYAGVSVLYFVIAALYYSLMESSSGQASVGKMALGIKVTDRDGNRLSFAHALGRWFAALLSYLTLYIGFFMAGFTERKRALHDIVAGTLVVDKWAFTANPERQQRELSGCLIAFLVVVLLMIGIAVLGIVAAVAIPAYSDYTGRTNLSVALADAGELKMRIAETVLSEQDGTCPDNGSAGYRAPEAYATAQIARIDIGASDEGGCGFTIWLKPTPGNEPQDYLALRFDAEDSRWICSSNLPDRSLPSSCR
jgi:uncharacterized RDD family membrane protein YckC